jgi:PAS domain S-box-containing protein
MGDLRHLKHKASSEADIRKLPGDLGAKQQQRKLPQKNVEHAAVRSNGGTENNHIQNRIARLNKWKEQLLGPSSLREKLTCLTDALVDVFGADFARIWVIRDGDLCNKGCRHASISEGPDICRDRTRCLHLVASSGRYTHIDGGHCRVPLGAYKIGRVASGEDFGFITNDVATDPRVHDHAWAKSLGLVSFGGYRILSPDGYPLGVLAFFSKGPINRGEEALLEDLAHTASQVIRAGIAEDALRRSEAYARRQLAEIELIYDSAPIGLCFLDTRMRYVRVNKMMAEYDGVPVAEHVGRTPREVMPALADPAEMILQQVIETGMPVMNIEFTGTTAAQPGVQRTWVLHWLPLKDEAGNVTGVNVVAEEVTEKKRTQEILQRAYDELEQRVKDRTTELTKTVSQLHNEIQERIRAEEALRREHITLQLLLQSSDHERQLIAYEIHDGLAQQLTGAIMQLQSYEHLKKTKPKVAEKSFAAGLDMLRQGHVEARRLISGVRPPILDESGIIAAISHLVHEHESRAGPNIEFHSKVEFKRLDPALENAIYRIVQEGTTNACTHSKSDKVRIDLTQHGDALKIEVRDWGIGFDVDEAKQGSFGLEGIRQRARLLGGRFKLQSTPGKGSRLLVELPLK